VAGERFDEPTHWQEETAPPSGRRSARERPDAAEADGGQGVHFPTRPIGYDRAAVDAYVEQVERRIADLEATQTPEAAIRRALEQVGEETSGILRHAQEAADDITTRSRSAADDRLETARRDADELRARAEGRVRRLDADADAIWRERSRLLDDMRRLSEELLTSAERAEMRFPPEESPANAPLAPEDSAIGTASGTHTAESADGEEPASAPPGHDASEPPPEPNSGPPGRIEGLEPDAGTS
jgi:DivIVA domain-containing protein